MAIRSIVRVSRKADETLRALIEIRNDINAGVESKVQTSQDKYDPDLLEFKDEEIRPRRSDLSIEQVALVWLPYAVDQHGNAARAF